MNVGGEECLGQLTHDISEDAKEEEVVDHNLQVKQKNNEVSRDANKNASHRVT